MDNVFYGIYIVKVTVSYYYNIYTGWICVRKGSFIHPVYIYHGFIFQLHTHYVFSAYFTKQYPILERGAAQLLRQVQYSTVGSSASAGTYVAHAAPGGFAGEIKYRKCDNKNAIVCCRFVRPAEVGSGDCDRGYCYR